MSSSTKVQKHKIGVAGSFTNQLMSNNSTIPVVGEGATRMHYTDRSCYEVLSVSEDGKTVILQDLTATADKTKDLEHGHQEWVFVPNGNTTTVTWRHGAWRIVRNQVVFTEQFISECNNKGFASIGAWLHKNDQELLEKIYAGHVFPSKVVEGITRMKKTYDKINIIFGRKDYYYDWSF